MAPHPAFGGPISTSNSDGSILLKRDVFCESEGRHQKSVKKIDFRYILSRIFRNWPILSKRGNKKYK